MNVVRIAVTRKFNLGNYETIAYHVEADLCLEDSVSSAFKKLEQLIEIYYREEHPSKRPVYTRTS